ncbi:hypothetical protein [Sinorhizobium americanum]|uniref:Uncharacterized protein n=1 Tax=Sinorhizobium americanum TaxID=194963 RepID=A0A1L3LS23_9HYPH|nr:hypothetical protein [Sinorhizobium americanum]APG92894.1 hypothetical protein SAMCFNEI73_Ch3644 [Sinorhizobium americanum]
MAGSISPDILELSVIAALFGAPLSFSAHCPRGGAGGTGFATGAPTYYIW